MKVSRSYRDVVARFDINALAVIAEASAGDPPRWIAARPPVARGEGDSRERIRTSSFDLDTFVRDTLAEDLGEGLPGGGRDVTSESVIGGALRGSWIRAIR